VVHIDLLDEIAVLTIDSPPVNASSACLRRDLVDALSRAAAAKVHGMVLIGANDTFIAGSDLTEFDHEQLPTPQLPQIISAIENLPIPVVAALDGHALGGGLELALACDARIGTSRLVVGLPEVTLGMVPGAGGTQRLPRAVGLSTALDMTARGTRLGGERAYELGLLDGLAQPAQLLAQACDLARATSKRLLIAEPVPPEPDEATAAALARATKATRVYPGAGEAIRLTLLAASGEPGEALRDERATFDKLRVSPEARALRHLFFAERRARRRGRGRDSGPVNRVGVVGAGTMGRGIAAAFANAGRQVVIIEANAEAAATAGQAIAAILDKHVSTGSVEISGDFSRLAETDLVVEAVFEDVDVKRDVIRAVESVVSADCVIATNTSYLDIEALASLVGGRERFLGLHFFAPANLMKLVEVVPAAATSTGTRATAWRAVTDLGKQPLLVGAAEGYVGNRLLSAYRRQAEYLLEDGALPRQVDSAMTRFGFRMGPFAVADLSGLQIAWAMRRARRARGEVPPRYVEIPDLLCEMGRFGRPADAGYYRYDNGEARDDPEVEEIIRAESARKGIRRQELDDDAIVMRSVGAIVNEAAILVRDGVAAAVDDIDVAMTSGFGFPRHRGGPAWWARTLTPDERDRMCSALEAADGVPVDRAAIDALLA
jgi:3-hydroxyacyl-CoA dehydrogenase